MTRRKIALFAVMFVAACQQAEDAPVASGVGETPPVATAQPSAVNELAPIETLAGEWRVAGIDGEPFDEPYGIALSADEQEIWWEPRCAGQGTPYRIDGLEFAVPGPPRGPGQPVEVCDIGVPERLDEVMRAIASATTIGRDPSNAIVLEGGGHSLTLYSQ